MKTTINDKGCFGCGICLDVCPVHAISLEKDGKGFSLAKIDSVKCIGCDKCSRFCKSEIANKPHLTCYAVKNKNDNLRKACSSGGVFYSLALRIIQLGGVVFGVAMVDGVVKHVSAESSAELSAMRGSKYVQSNIGDSFYRIRLLLESGRYVLFSGTPCQIYELKKHLSKEYQRLFLVDIICHGVASPLFWEKYYSFLCDNSKNKIDKVNFRDKSTGWHRFSFSYLSRKKKHIVYFADDPYCYFYDKHYILNNRCFTCEFTYKTHYADITIGDFWGIEQLLNDFDDNKGVSLVVINTEKGHNLFQEQANDYSLIRVDYEKAMSFNMNSPAEKPQKYDEFWEYYFSHGMKKTIKRFFSYSIKINFKRFVKKIMIKLHLNNLFIK